MENYDARVRRADCDLLGIPRDIEVSPTDIKCRFRELALKLHPDLAGGDQARFEAVRGAYERLYAEAQLEWAKCPRCDGSGTVRKQVGFEKLTETCDVCAGSGVR